MDKLSVISGCLFLAADVFAIASLVHPDWINTGGSAGSLMWAWCRPVARRSTDRVERLPCLVPPRLPPEWVTTLFFIILGIISLTVTCGLLVVSHWHREATRYARWIAFTGMVLFCLAALIFPVGFYISEVGGQPYKLPNNAVVGSSYVLFVLAIFFTIVGLLFAGKGAEPPVSARTHDSDSDLELMDARGVQGSADGPLGVRGSEVGCRTPGASAGGRNAENAEEEESWKMRSIESRVTNMSVLRAVRSAEVSGTRKWAESALLSSRLQ
ncbi:hypothetical protein CRUP_033948, partial [Coryphaenoides rupestris]